MNTLEIWVAIGSVVIILWMLHCAREMDRRVMDRVDAILSLSEKLEHAKPNSTILVTAEEYKLITSNRFGDLSEFNFVKLEEYRNGKA